MESRHASLLYRYTVCGIFCVCLVTSQHPFNAVSSFGELVPLYLKMRIREPHLEPDLTVDVETKRRICQSIATSGFFVTAHKDSVDMDQVYFELKSEAKKETLEEGTPAKTYYEAVLNDYDMLRSSCWRRKIPSYRYSTILTTFDIRDSTLKEKEFAFACAVRDHYTSVHVIFYISDVYDLNTSLNVSVGERIRARFICLVARGRCPLTAIAEEPATAFPSSEYNVESVYLQMRRTHTVAETAADDPVCGLTRSEKLRVCASIMASSNFADRVKFRTIYKCERRKVSFRTMHVRREDDEVADDYYEWMLTCSVEPIALAWSVYHVSRAYQSRYAIVYTQDYRKYYLTGTCEYVIESIHANVNVIVDYEGKPPSPSLTSLLEDSQLYWYYGD